MKDYATLWVCVDCLMDEATGGNDEGRDERNPAPWSAIHPDDAHRPITMGLVYEEHAEDCPNFDSDGDYLGYEDEPCEDISFSWSRCHGCGSTLGGSRHAYTMHLEG